MANDKKSMFVLADGRNVVVTFMLVSSLFLLWGFCNGMIDVMDKHFQTELHLTLAQSAWVQFAHYLGYFLMALPAGWLATKLGYKGGIIAGLLMVAVGNLQGQEICAVIGASNHLRNLFIIGDYQAFRGHGRLDGGGFCGLVLAGREADFFPEAVGAQAWIVRSEGRRVNERVLLEQ
jgi:MFS family permease